jgi:hypothetical protein
MSNNLKITIMKSKKLSLKLWKTAEILSVEQLKTLLGGLMEGSGGFCIGLGSSCNSSVQCCTFNCVVDSSDTVTGKRCGGIIG